MKQFIVRLLKSAIGAGLALWTLMGVAYSSPDEPELDYIKVPREIHAGFIERGSVRLDYPAGEGGVIVVIVSDRADMVSYPGRIFIPEGRQTGSFPIRASINSKSRYAKFAATTGDDGVVARTRLRAAPAQSRTILQRAVPIRSRVVE